MESHLSRRSMGKQDAYEKGHGCCSYSSKEGQQEKSFIPSPTLQRLVLSFLNPVTIGCPMVSVFSFVIMKFSPTLTNSTLLDERNLSAGVMCSTHFHAMTKPCHSSYNRILFWAFMLLVLLRLCACQYQYCLEGRDIHGRTDILFRENCEGI